MSLLHIGDIISLYSSGFLSTLGLVDDRCVLQDHRQHGQHGQHDANGTGDGGGAGGGGSTSQDLLMPKDPPKKFRDCLFRVCFQNKYDVQNELWRSSHIDEELNKKLYEAARYEQHSNQEKNQSKRGHVVKYEDTIQLLHIKSNKYVTVNTKASAPEDKAAIRVYLDSNGNEGSWFKVRSPYKYRSMGEDVICESIALVCDVMGSTALNHEEALYLHASSHYLSDNPDLFEINASRQSTSWTVKPFLDHTQDLEDFLKGGDVVRLFHTDQEKFLTMDTYNGDQTHYVFLRSTDRAKATSATSSKALWEVEVVHPDPCRASPARWNSLIRLKHLATERFLAADLDDDSAADQMRDKLRNKGAPVYKLTSIEFSYDYATLFEFDSTTTNVNADDYIPIHSNITLKHHPTGTYVHSTSIYIDKDKKKNCMSKVGCAQNKGLDEVFAVIPVLATEIRDLDFVYDASVMLNEAHDLIKEDANLGRVKAHKKLIELLAEIMHFIANKEGEPRKVEKAPTMLAENPNRERQKLLREQNVLKLLFDILELEDGLEANRDICQLCYKVLSLSFKDYRKNQEYIVKWDKFMQRQFGKDICAESTYAALFNSNKNLLEKTVTGSDVSVFIDLIRMKRQANFLDCLSDLCITSNGSVCPATQSLICEFILFKSNDDILVETFADQTSGHILLSTKHWIPYNDTSFVRDLCRTSKSLHEIVVSARDGCERDAFILNYYRHQLDLFSALCVGRQLEAINAISEKLSLKLVQQCVRDGELPSELRASFCKLLLHLYLIKGSRSPVAPINLKRKWTDIAEKVSVEIYDYHDNNDLQAPLAVDEFVETMEFVEMYLNDLTAIPSRSIFSNIQRNKLTYEVINLNRELTYFGFYKLSDFLRLAEILLVLLEDDKNQQRLVMRTKTKIIETLQYMADVRLDYMLTSLLAIFKLNQQQSTSSSSNSNNNNNNSNNSQHLGQQQQEHLAGAAPHNLISPNGFSSLSSQTAISAIRTDQALDKHLNEINLDNSNGRKFVNVLLQLVRHDDPDLVSASLKLLLNYRSQRQRILETFRRVEFVNSTPEIEEKFRKLHPLIERSDKYIRKGRDENHVIVNEVLLSNSKLVSFIVQHVLYLIKNKDEKQLTRDLLRLLGDMIPHENADYQPTTTTTTTARPTASTGATMVTPATTTTSASEACESPLNSTGGGAPTGLPISASSATAATEKTSSASSNTTTTTTTNNNNNNIKKTAKGAKVASARPLSLTQIQSKLDSHGVSNLVVELIAMSSALCEEKVRERSAAVFKDTLALGIAMLEGGNQTNQGSIYDKLTRKSEQEKSERFFEVLSNRMSLAQQALSPSLDSPAYSKEWAFESRLILRFLQLLCEDHNLTMQKFLFLQRNKTSFNLVAKTLVFLNCICGSKEGSLGHRLGEYIKENNVDLINQTLRTLTEYCQGPCIENQRCILMHESNGIDMIRSLILDSIEPLYSLRMDLVLELKDNATKLLLALMESCSDPHHAARILREPTLTKKLINVSIALYHEQDDYDDIFAGLNCEETPNSTDGIVMPRDVGHKVFILCHQLVQQYNMLTASEGAGAGAGPLGFSGSLVAKISTSDEANMLADKCDHHQSADKEVLLREASALYYYESHTAQIEIVRSDRTMERVVFPVPQICEYLTDETKTQVYHDTEQDERGSKIPCFFQKVDELFEEMKWQRELQTKPILHSIARYMSLWSDLEFKLSFLVTVLVLFCVSKSTTMHNQFSLYTMIFLLKVLSLFLECVTTMHLFSVLINSGIVNKQPKQILGESDVLYHGGYLLVCTLGFLWNPLFYPFLLPPSLIKREETLRNVIKSVTKNAYSILMTGFLGLIIILLYTIVVYLYFANDFIISMEDGSDYQPCLGTLWECYVAHVNYGLRDGGGIGERIRDVRLDLSTLNVFRIIFIVSFFLVVNLLILQLVYCIIVDSFATLRGEKHSKEESLRNTCFVCGLDRSSFEHQPVTFEEHIQLEHNLWHYLYFIVLIKIKSRTELSGPESFVYDMIKSRDHSWFPRMRAMCQSD